MIKAHHFCRLPLSWFRSYLANRLQYVEIDGTKYSFTSFQCGVPQGSVLGRSYTLIFINDLFYSSKLLSFILFADDTNIFYRRKDISALTERVNAVLINVLSWFKANRLTFHPDKTKFILFHPSR